jgi:hypothetical protein
MLYNFNYMIIKGDKLMTKTKEFTKRFKKLSCITFAFCIFLSLSLFGCSSNTKDKTDTSKKISTESNKDKKDDSIFQDVDKSKDNTSSSTSSITNNNTSTKDNNAQSTTQAQQPANTNSTPSQAPAQQSTTKAESSNNRTVYYVPGSSVYHYSKSDGTLKKSKTILEMTEGEALAKGMHLTQSKADQH